MAHGASSSLSLKPDSPACLTVASRQHAFQNRQPVFMKRSHASGNSAARHHAPASWATQQTGMGTVYMPKMY